MPLCLQKMNKTRPDKLWPACVREKASGKAREEELQAKVKRMRAYRRKACFQTSRGTRPVRPLTRTSSCWLISERMNSDTE